VLPYFEADTPFELKLDSCSAMSRSISFMFRIDVPFQKRWGGSSGYRRRALPGGGGTDTAFTAATSPSNEHRISIGSPYAKIFFGSPRHHITRSVLEGPYRPGTRTRGSFSSGWVG
jgi:hypothetical protein